MPALSGYLDKLLAAILRVLLTFVKEFNCLCHLGSTNLIGDTVGADYYSSVFRTISLENLHGWRGNDAALLCHIISETA